MVCNCCKVSSSICERPSKFACLLVLYALLLVPLADAQTYSQPMLGISWSTHEISVAIPASPAWASDALKTAMTDWEDAQSWFIQTYFKGQNGAGFYFMPSTNNPQPQLRIEFVNDTGQFWTGNTEVPVSGPIVNETVLLVLRRLATASDVIQVAHHELGHVLGLDHTAYIQDLMYPAMDAYSGGAPVYPSTVNLYGVFMLGEECTFSPGQAAVVPSWIPYLEWSPDIQQTSVNTPQSASSTNPCPPERALWTQPWLVFPLAVGLAIVVFVIFNLRRKRTPRATKSVQY